MYINMRRTYIYIYIYRSKIYSSAHNYLNKQQFACNHRVLKVKT